jgi:hypothetical protein
VGPAARTGLLIAALLAAPAPVRAWIDEGHQVIGALAERRLSPAARAMVREILGDGHLWDHDVALWADDHRDRTSAPWHYVDIPFATGRYEAPRDCPGGRCAVARIEWAARVLRASDDLAQRLEALRWLVHAVGDLHQPLHAAEGWRPGGNRGGVLLPAHVGRRQYQESLHVIWDAEVLWPVLGGKPPLEAAAALDEEITEAQRIAWTAERSPAAWAEASNRVARDVYRELGVTPTRTEPLEVSEAWVLAQRGRVVTALGQASLRLAAALDRIAAERAGR